jgi:hypothetical protein
MNLIEFTITFMHLERHCGSFKMTYVIAYSATPNHTALLAGCQYGFRNQLHLVKSIRMTSILAEGRKV